ncbi:MAG: prepilin-type N-terminal cleavage/methylation domain-containing protein [Phycisphaerales bacterium]
MTRHSAAARRACRAFTLLEVLVALALAILLLGALMAFLGQLQRQRAVLTIESDQLQGAGLLMDRLEGELLCVVAGDAVVGAGVKGDSNSLALLSLVVPSVRSGGRAAFAQGGMVRTTYTFDPAAALIRASRVDVLAAGGTPSTGEIGRGMTRVRFRYYAKSSSGIGTWRDSFDALTEGGLPLAIEVALWFGSSAPAGPDPSSPEPDALLLTDTVGLAATLPPPDRVRLIAVSGGPTEAPSP